MPRSVAPPGRQGSAAPKTAASATSQCVRPNPLTGADVTASLVTAWHAAERGDRIAAHAVYLRLLPLLVYQAQSMGTIIGSAKTILQRRGIIATTQARHPQGVLSDTSASRVLELAQQAAEV